MMLEILGHLQSILTLALGLCVLYLMLSIEGQEVKKSETDGIF